MPGRYPIYLPSKMSLSEKLIYQSHLKAILGGVNLTMTNIRSDYWIPTLRQLTKKIINKCPSFKRFNTKPYNTAQYKVSYRKIEQNKIYPLKSLK